MNKPLQWLTIAELRAELQRTHPAWQVDVQGANLDRFLATGDQAELSADARRYLAVLVELDRRASEQI